MASYYVDSSGLVKRYIQEPGTDRLVAMVESAHRIVVSRLALVEVTSAVSRRGRAGDVAPADIEEVLDALAHEFRDRFEVLDLLEPILNRAADLARAHVLRAPDAIQLACALLARSSDPDGAGDGVTFVCSDRELNAAARAEGLAVLDPAAE